MKNYEEYGNFRLWLSKTILVSIIFITLIYITDIVLHIDILRDVLIVIVSILVIGFCHEALHYYQAVKLGYKPKWYRTRFMMGFEITPHTNRKIWREHKKKIALLPYKVLIVPLIIMCLIGVYYSIWSFLLSGVVGIVTHAISIFKEGQEI